MYDRALRLVRLYNNRSQTSLAIELGLSKSYISEIESGAKKPSIDVLERYASAFDFPLSQLLLFAESSGGGITDRVRHLAIDKTLSMLEWLERLSDDRAA